MVLFTQRVDLNVADLAHISVTAQKNLPVNNNSRAGTAVQTN